MKSNQSSFGRRYKPVLFGATGDTKVARDIRIILITALALGLAMNWYCALDGQQTGPVSETQLDELVCSGKINRDTPVGHEGMADWQPLHAVRAADQPPPPGMSSGVVCVECGRTFPPGEVIKTEPVPGLRAVQTHFPPASHRRGRARRSRHLAAGQATVTRSETPFPDRCVKCNAPAGGFKLKRVLYWQYPAYYLLILCNLLIPLIVVLIVRKKAILHVGVCEKHRAQRKLALTIGWVGVLGGLVLLICGVVWQSGWAAIAGLVLMLGGGIYGAVRGTTISAAKITKDNVWVRGVHKDFLAQLPEWPGL